MIELWDGARSEDWKSEVEPPGGEVMKDWKRRLSGMQATNTKTKTKNEKRLSGMQATEIMNTEILKLEKPEFLKIDFLEEKFKNEFLLKAEQQAQKDCVGEAPATTAEEPDERRKLVRVEVPGWTVSRREVPNSQGGVRHLQPFSFSRPFDCSLIPCEVRRRVEEPVENTLLCAGLRVYTSGV